jgi:hypothetical protein
MGSYASRRSATRLPSTTWRSSSPSARGCGARTRELGTGALEAPRAAFRETGDPGAFGVLVRDADAALAAHAERINYAR